MIQVLFTFKTWIDNSKQKPAEQIQQIKHKSTMLRFDFFALLWQDWFEFWRKIVSLFTYLGPQTQAWVV